MVQNSRSRKSRLTIEAFATLAACTLLVIGIARVVPAAQEANRVSGHAEAAAAWGARLDRRLTSARSARAHLVMLRRRERRELAAISRAAAGGFIAVRDRGSEQGARGGARVGQEEGIRAARRENRKLRGGWFFVGIDWRDDGLPFVGTKTKLDPSSWEAYWVEDGEIYYRETG
jgi:hypothetical protein